jgi:DNA modification methylase
MVRQERSNSLRGPRKVAEIKPAKCNPRKISDQQLEVLKRAMREFGDLSGLVMNLRTGHLVGGHQRLKHLDPSWPIVKRPYSDRVGTKAAGYVQTPFGRFTYREVDWPKHKEIAANLAANKISGEWDNEKLAPILQELVTLPEFDLTGFTAQEANLVIEEFPLEPANDGEDDVTALSDEAQTKPGQLWRLGDHRLLCGDATDPHAWNKLMDGHSAAAIIMDPPYGVDYQLSEKFRAEKLNDQVVRKKHHKTTKHIAKDETHAAAMKVTSAALGCARERMVKNWSGYLCCGLDLLVDAVNWLRQESIHYSIPFIVWDKGFPVVTWSRYHGEHEDILWFGPGSLPGGHSRWFGPKNETSMWRIPIDARASERLHPTQKPVALYERPIVNSTAPGEIAVDPFAGSGPLLIAAEKHQRRAYLMEIDPRYCDVIIKRWIGFTGRKLGNF